MSSYPCPVCRQPATLDGPCPGCGRAPDHDAAEVIRLDTEIAALTERLDTLRRDYGTASAELQQAQAKRSRLAAKVWAAAHPVAPVPQPAAHHTPASAPASARPGSSARPEASVKTVQNVLLILGGLLLGTAAIVFTAVAWATFGDAGRALILAAITVVALGVPPVALARGLRATAETFAALGLLLVVLDGFAAWYVNLLGVADHWPGSTYAGVVLAVTAATGLGYGLVTGLAGPRLIAVLAVQPTLPLLLASTLGDRPTGWALLFALLAAGNLGLAALAGRGPVALAVRSIAGVAYAVQLLYTLAAAQVLLWSGDHAAWTGPVTIAAGTVVLIAGGLATRRPVPLGAACAWAVISAVEVVWRTADGDRPLLWVSAAVAAIGLLLARAGTAATPAADTPQAATPADATSLAAAARLGARCGALAAAVPAAAVAVLGALTVAVESIADATPWWHAEPVPSGDPYGWSLPVSLLLLTVAAVALTRPGFGTRTARVGTPDAAVGVATPGGLGGAAGVSSALDAAVGVFVATVLAAAPDAAAAPWLPSTLDLAGLVALLAYGWWRARSGTATAPLAAGIGAAVLGTHGLAAALGTPVRSAAVTAALILLGSAAALVTRGTPTPARRVIGTVGLATAAALTPLLVASLAEARDARPTLVFHSAIATIALLPAAMLVLRRRGAGRQLTAQDSSATGGAGTTRGAGRQLAMITAQGLLAAVTVVLAVVRGAGDPPVNPVYVAIGGFALAAAVTLSTVDGRRSAGTRAALLVVPGLAAVWTLPTLLAVFGVPLTWLGDVWAGATGTGLRPPGTGGPNATARDAAALTIVTVTLALTAYLRGGTVAAGLRTLARTASVPVLVWLTVTAAPWPAVPLTTLLTGLGVLGYGALAYRPDRVGRTDRLPAAFALLAATVQTISGFAGMLPAQWSTILAFALVTAAFGTVAGLAGTTWLRLAAALGGGLAWIGLALTSALAADLRPRYVGLTLLTAAATLLVAATVPRLRTTRVDLRVLEPLAHVTALVTLGLAVPSARRVAETLLLWGVAVGLTALWSPKRVPRAAAAGGIEAVAWWALLISQDVRVLEAYTIPVAVVGLVLGFLAMRRRPELSSWLGYGPALAAALAPSTVAMLPLDSTPWRRLLLGAVALAVVVGGAVRRRQAPVVLGGAVLVLLALHEIVVSWDLLPRWGWIGIGGAVLVGLGVTYERRRRDLDRLRATISTMR